MVSGFARSCSGVGGGKYLPYKHLQRLNPSEKKTSPHPPNACPLGGGVPLKYEIRTPKRVRDRYRNLRNPILTQSEQFWSLGHWYFEFISDFVFRVSDLGNTPKRPPGPSVKSAKNTVWSKRRRRESLLLEQINDAKQNRYA